MEKSLDRKLAEIHANAGSRAFILADAKDADMAFGVVTPGRDPQNPSAGFRSLENYHQHIRENTRQALLDIMLISGSTNYHLTIKERAFDNSTVTPAVRMNDTTDIHLARGSAYSSRPARPFSTVTVDQAQCGANRPDGEQIDRAAGANLGLFSVTFNNDVDLDLAMADAYRRFRIEAEQKGFRHFLEVFSPNAPVNKIQAQTGDYINDMIGRLLAGVPQPGRPVFLKMNYYGPKFMEDLVSYDRHLVPGILGGAAGTTYDAFKLLEDARTHGARAALFGRKINCAEDQLSFIECLRAVADWQISAQEAVRMYHGKLQGMGIKPVRSLADDMVITNKVIGSYSSSAVRSIPAKVKAGRKTAKPKSARARKTK